MSANVAEKMSETEVKQQINNRIADLLGVTTEELKQFDRAPNVMSTPSVLSAVRATAYIHC